MKKRLLFLSVSLLLFSCEKRSEVITLDTLLCEMTELSRLAKTDEISYRTVQFSSYDRRSTKPSDSLWFSNSDGFGNEPIPGFEKVLKEPGEDGIGEYLICEIQNPGAILRLWSAGINGKIRLYLDDLTSPCFEGEAEDFFWRTLDALSENELKTDSFPAFRQFDALYFPIPFAQRCRIEWIGDIKKTHFYHIGVRIYNQDTEVETLDSYELLRKKEAITRTNEALLENLAPDQSNKQENYKIDVKIPEGSRSDLYTSEKGAAIKRLELKINAGDYDNCLRKNIIHIYFDNATEPQVRAPLGDFFVTAPGIYPYHSLPMSVRSDSTMVCQLLMPYRQSVRIEIENRSGEEVGLSGKICTISNKWAEGRSMHFYAQWRIDHDLTARNHDVPGDDVEDILYLDVKGTGRIIGAAAFIYNPSNVPTSWGNWWGEGDEKIFIDQDSFPSFFGTGSEDYFNYSWSSSKLFSYSYCGQPRNDGPGNRGYATNFRWHISDDIPFSEKASFYMELWHHGTVPGFSYGRIVYFYALPGLHMESKQISDEDVRDFSYLNWLPESYAGSASYRFIQAEKLISSRQRMEREAGSLYAGGAIMRWNPAFIGDTLSFILYSNETKEHGRIGFTMVHEPDGGSISVKINGNPLKFRGKESINLYSEQQILDNHISNELRLNRGPNTILFESLDGSEASRVGVDFIWIQK